MEVVEAVYRDLKDLGPASLNIYIQHQEDRCLEVVSSVEMGIIMARSVCM